MHRRQGGFGMFEAMVSILVVSIGFLGFAGAQIRGLSQSNSALLRSKAVELAYQMTDRARGNLPGAQSGAYNALTGTATNPGCSTTGCTTGQMAQTDYAEWSAAVAAALPSGKGVICLDSTPDDGDATNAGCDGAGATLAVKIFWTEKSGSYRFVNPFRP